MSEVVAVELVMSEVDCEEATGVVDEDAVTEDLLLLSGGGGT